MAINGTNGDDAIKGTDESETIVARAGDDIIKALGGDDTVRAGLGDDNVDAGNGDDTVYGGAGEDDIRGGKGADTMSGGADADTFTFYAGADFRTSTDDDVILDFELGLDLLFIQAPGGYSFDLSDIGDDLVLEVVTTHNGVDRGSITLTGLGIGDEFTDQDTMSAAEVMALFNDYLVV